MIELRDNTTYTEDELVTGLGCTRAWLRRRVGGSLVGRTRVYLGRAVLAKMKPCASEEEVTRILASQRERYRQIERNEAPSARTHETLTQRARTRSAARLALKATSIEEGPDE